MRITSLQRALTETTDPDLRALPESVAVLLAELDAPPRLGAHLRAVHDVAARLLAGVGEACPGLAVSADEVLFGAATHDIGKVEHPSELSGPGSAHEPAGYELLVARGVAPRLARFARDHGSVAYDGLSIEDLLVVLADKVWKGKRVPELEDEVTARWCAASGEQPWEAFLRLDDLLERLARDADARLAFQSRHPL
ncbi:HD domain-containing protein [Catellatospora citrea]|uniref:Phosphohydrolase n=1 Tax=Catellatospora citrea TaxID=53366 RepID=A0A8J3K8V4_9ACTN|nr:HD domain-containing protein [Catellatospora citrea]RKE12497.1 HD domain-containing protein [Catellatospora citrea]GIF96269.1 phosphohydrolase [Catellatospora citrea]